MGVRLRSALIVANRTVGGAELIDAVKQRLANDRTTSST